MATYRCLDCGREYSEYIEICSNSECKSNNIQEVYSTWEKIIFYGKQPRVYISVGLALFMLILLRICTPCGEPEKIRYKLSYDKIDKGIKLKATKVKKFPECENETEKVGKRTLVELAESISLEAENEDKENVTFINGKLYPCDSNSDVTEISVTWKNHINYQMMHPDSSWKIRIRVKGEKPHKLANCGEPTQQLRITNVTAPNDDCKIKVLTSLDNTPDSGQVWISVKGRNGKYNQKRIWDASGLDKYLVYAALNGDTVAYGSNKGQMPPCNEKSPNAVRSEVKKRFNQYLANPGLKTIQKLESALGVVGKRTDAKYTIKGYDTNLDWGTLNAKINHGEEYEGQKFEVSRIVFKNKELYKVIIVETGRS